MPVAKEEHATRPSVVTVRHGKFDASKVKARTSLSDLAARATFVTKVQHLDIEVVHVGAGIVIRGDDFILIRELTRRLLEARLQHLRRPTGGKRKTVPREELEVSVEIPLYALYSAIIKSFWPDEVQGVLMNPSGSGGGPVPEFHSVREEAAFCKCKQILHRVVRSRLSNTV